MPDRDLREVNLRAQLEAIRAQAMAIIAAVDTVLDPEPEPDVNCCEKPERKVTETYTTRTEYCGKCGAVWSRIPIGAQARGGEEGNG